MTPEEYIINRIHELEKDNKSLERFLSGANTRIKILEDGIKKLLLILDFLFDKLEIKYDHRTGVLEVGSDNLLVENKDLEEYLKIRDKDYPRGEQALRENAYRSWGHNGLEKDPIYDKVIDNKGR